MSTENVYDVQRNIYIYKYFGEKRKSHHEKTQKFGLIHVFLSKIHIFINVFHDNIIY